MSPEWGDSFTTDLTGHDLSLTFSPLFHATAGIGELVVGPKLGYWSDNFTWTRVPLNSGRQISRLSQSGWAYGINIGVFAGVSSHVSLGLLLSYQFIATETDCVHGPNPASRGCPTDGSLPLLPPEILGITAAAIF
jgi:hypothetical protein